jgi:hypothetical protein
MAAVERYEWVPATRAAARRFLHLAHFVTVRQRRRTRPFRRHFIERVARAPFKAPWGGALGRIADYPRVPGWIYVWVDW